MTVRTENKPDMLYGVNSHDYGNGHADWTLSTSEQLCTYLTVTNANQAANIIAPNKTGRRYVVKNSSGYNITIKISGGTGITIATSKVAAVFHNGSDYVRETADQAY